MLDDEKTGEKPATEEKETHEPAHTQEHETEPEREAEPEVAEEDCDEAIAGLIADIEALRDDNTNLREELRQLRELHESHERDNEHTPRRVEGGDADGNVEPLERHWYFRRIGGKH